MHRAALAGGDIGLRQMAKGMFVIMNLDGQFLSFNLESRSMPQEGLVHCQTLGYSRRRSEGKRWRKKYVSLNLVHSYWASWVVSVNWWKSNWHQPSTSEQLTMQLLTPPPFVN